MSILQPWAENIWTVDGPDVDFFTFPYPTRMVVVRLTSGSSNNNKGANGADNDNNGGKEDALGGDGGAWLWSPTPWSAELQQEIERVCGGPIRHIVSPNRIHWLFMLEWQKQCPQAIVYASPGLAERTKALPPELHFDATLTDVPDSRYANDIDQVILWGQPLPEVVFFHKSSSTLIVCDYIQRFPKPSKYIKGWKGALLQVGGVVGPNGTAPSDLRSGIWLTGGLPSMRKALNRIRTWEPDKLIIAHGDNVASDATPVIERSFSWVPEHPRESSNCCGCWSCLVKPPADKED